MTTERTGGPSCGSPADVALSPGVSDYAEAIGLHQPFIRVTGDEAHARAVLPTVVEWLLRDASLDEHRVPTGFVEQRALMVRLLTTRPARPIPDHAHHMLDILFASDASQRPVTTVAELLRGPGVSRSVGTTAVRLWRGDITSLAIDAIVNAANADLLGCFLPGHQCIDNAIHSAAGPRLRDDCNKLMQRQGHREPTGRAKATRGYFLPANFVLHTVGPIVGDGRVAPAHRLLLKRCYESCLSVAAQIGARSVAFCAVSTGVFGYPKDDAAVVALTAVTEWLERHPGALDTVIFNVFGVQDDDAYRRVGGWR